MHPFLPEGTHNSSNTSSSIQGMEESLFPRMLTNPGVLCAATGGNNNGNMNNENGPPNLFVHPHSGSGMTPPGMTMGHPSGLNQSPYGAEMSHYGPLYYSSNYSALKGHPRGSPYGRAPPETYYNMYQNFYRPPPVPNSYDGR